jgi:hypothetical protein
MDQTAPFLHSMDDADREVEDILTDWRDIGHRWTNSHGVPGLTDDDPTGRDGSDVLDSWPTDVALAVLLRAAHHLLHFRPDSMDEEVRRWEAIGRAALARVTPLNCWTYRDYLNQARRLLGEPQQVKFMITMLTTVPADVRLIPENMWAETQQYEVTITRKVDGKVVARAEPDVLKAH